MTTNDVTERVVVERRYNDDDERVIECHGRESWKMPIAVQTGPPATDVTADELRAYRFVSVLPKDGPWNRGFACTTESLLRHNVYCDRTPDAIEYELRFYGPESVAAAVQVMIERRLIPEGSERNVA
jgi:hypothetical protein